MPTQIALVTGANQGIGFQIAKDLVAQGLTVLIGSRNLQRGIDAANEIGGSATAIHLDVTDRVSIAKAAERIAKEFGHLDILVNNAAISNVRKTQLGLSLQDSIKDAKPSQVSIDEVKAIWETNVFGVLAVYQAMLPLLQKAPFANIVNVSSGVGSLTQNSNRDHQYRPMFIPGYSASKTALNAMTLSMAIEQDGTSVKVNAITPGFTKTNLNGYEGTETLEEGSREAVRVALLGPDAPNGLFTRWPGEIVPW